MHKKVYAENIQKRKYPKKKAQCITLFHPYFAEWSEFQKNICLLIKALYSYTPSVTTKCGLQNLFMVKKIDLGVI